MILHWLQHVPFEDLGAIGPWALAHDHELRRVALHAGEPLRTAGAIKGLIVMGGPMSVHDHDRHPWLAEELDLIRDVLADGRPCLGICLGAQLMAAALGGAVAPGREPEIGWFPVTITVPDDDPLHGSLPAELTAFHWHGEAFDLPPGCTRLAGNPACPQQIVRCGDRSLALQCHLEITPAGIEALCTHCHADIAQGGRFVQDASSMRDAAAEHCRHLAPPLAAICGHCFGPTPP